MYWKYNTLSKGAFPVFLVNESVS